MDGGIERRVKPRIGGRTKAVILVIALAVVVLLPGVLIHPSSSLADPPSTTIPKCVGVTIYVTQPPITPLVCPLP